MATAYQNLSACDNNTVPYSPQLRVAVVCAEWRKVKVAGHAQAVLEHLQSLQ